MPHNAPPSIQSILLTSSPPTSPSTSTLMDSGSPPHVISPHDDNRPPGGTRRTNGTKTPRKVQWHDERDAEDPNASTRALDEHGLDPSAFETLTDALERHRAVSPSELPKLDTVLTRESSSTTTDTESPETMNGSPSHTVAGEAFIDPSETAGLPGAGTERHSVQQAQKVISAHRRSFFGGMHMPHVPHMPRRHTETRDASGHKSTSSTGGEVRKRKPKKKKKSRWFGLSATESELESDVERAAESPLMPPPPRGGGVLSALLQLYDSNDAASGTVASLSAQSSLEDLRTPAMFPPTRTATQDSVSEKRDYFQQGERGRVRDGEQRRARSQERPRWAGSANSSLVSVSNLPNLRVPKPWGDSRPPQARSGAGVFGPLIASTGNISGVAAPKNSTLAPNIKRPGYRLSRYSLESNLPQVKDEVEPQLSRPRSMHFETSNSGDSVPEHPSHLRTSSLPMNAFEVSPKFGKWTGVLKDLPKRTWSHVGTPSTPGTPTSPTSEDELLEKERLRQKEKEDKRRREKRRRKKAEVFITRHVAEIVQRQEFIMKLARAMMMFGGPTHRLQAQIQSTAKVLDITLSCMYLPDVMLISFEDPTTSTSNIKFIRQASALDIGKLQDAHALYWKVIHDDISVQDASAALDDLMRKTPLYKFWQLILIGGCCSSFICSVSFNGSFIDSLVSFPLGCLLIVIQVFAARNELYSNVFEITVTLLFSFISAALADVGPFCYTAVGASSIVLILPGFIILCGSLELASRNIVSGAVRVCFSLIYSLFLGFGLSIGATAYTRITHHTFTAADDLTCNKSHDPNGPWYQRTPSLWWAFLTVPMYSLFLSLRNHAPYYRVETILVVAISCIGWVCNHFTGTKFIGQSDISAAVGGLAVGFVANMYGRFFRNGNAFVVMITGILFQLPSGLANGGLFSFVSDEAEGSSSNTSYISGFDTALQLVSVSIGLTVGLGISLVLVHPVSSRRRAGGVFSL
ncbi:uncharacterized protein FIBRA_07433 [Fibroporia radiculosa]|uniref:Threonine/serine exporter-like N-terminal domain-containing protein n=1 Tax=Fibroporia radiculosa TaxID=599839 RepID=J4GEF3_9APHY|nr:uncharacterized protein FIBRA_07433 [Fibroporia radiculosa]CCM05223.1 predicted protein [Fibroporia radiculosa]